MTLFKKKDMFNNKDKWTVKEIREIISEDDSLQIVSLDDLPEWNPDE